MVDEEASEQETVALAQAHAHYAAAVVHEMNNRDAEALDEYFQAASQDPGDESLVLEVTRRLMLAKQLDKALHVLERSAKQPDASGAVFARLGLLYFQVGQTNQAVTANRTAIKKSPASLAGYQNLFVWYLQGQRTNLAWQVLEDAFGQTRAEPDFLVGLADLYINYAIQVPAGRSMANDRAVNLLKKSAAAPGIQTGVRLKLADTLAALGDTESAAGLYQELLKKLPAQGPVREQVHARLADFYLRRSDRRRAVEQLEALVAQDPANPQAHYFLGSIAYDEKDLAAAVEHFRKTLILAPDFEQAYYDLASAQLGLNKADEAITTLSRARASFEQNFILEMLSALACMQTKNYAGAVERFTAAEVIARAIEPKRLTGQFYFQAGAAYERNRDYSQAEALFRKCLVLSPDLAEAQNYLGYMWAEQGTNLVEARELIEKAVKAQPTNAAYLDSLAWVLFKQGDSAGALKHILKAVELIDEPDPALFDHLGDIYLAQDQAEQAREAWKKSLEIEPSEAIRKKLESHAPP